LSGRASITVEARALNNQGDKTDMLNRTRKRVALATLAAATALGLGIAQQASAENPVGLVEYFPAHELYQATQAGKQVTFFAEVNSDEVGIDVISVSNFTEFNIQAFAKCTGVEVELIDEDGDSPLSALDDAIVDCPFFSRGEVIQAGVGIYPLPQE
jgi:ABC-type sugar transport system substrate-binding protein